MLRGLPWSTRPGPGHEVAYVAADFVDAVKQSPGQ